MGTPAPTINPPTVTNDALHTLLRMLEETPPETPLSVRLMGHLDDDGVVVPDCLLGRYAHRRDLQSVFTLELADSTFKNVMVYAADAPDRHLMTALDFDSPRVCEHFHLNRFEAENLFGFHACGRATTVAAAAAHVRGFLAVRSAVAA